MDLNAVLREVETWSSEDLLQLMNELQDRIAHQGCEMDLNDELKDELDRRLEEMDHNPNAGIPWEIAKTRLLTRFQA